MWRREPLSLGKGQRFTRFTMARMCHDWQAQRKDLDQNPFFFSANCANAISRSNY
jgi:hypothetical protein